MMKNKLSIKQILIVLSLIFSLLGLLKPLTVQATDAGGWLGNAIGDVDGMNQGNSGGPTYARTGMTVNRRDPYQIQ